MLAKPCRQPSLIHRHRRIVGALAAIDERVVLGLPHGVGRSQAANVGHCVDGDLLGVGRCQFEQALVASQCAMAANDLTVPTNLVSRQLLALIAEPPSSTRRLSSRPADAARKAAREAAAKAALAAGALALPPGPLGWLTILPEMLAVWRIQAQLVADIAALYGRTAQLGPTQMLYCLFRQTAAQAVRDLAVRVGERIVVRPLATAALAKVAAAVGLKLGEKIVGKSLSRWVPVLGAAGVSAYAFYDTRQVGLAALALFERDQVIDLP